MFGFGRRRDQLGEASFPSGTVAVVDTGLLGEPTDVIEKARVKVEGAPRARAFPVWGERVGKGRWSDCWKHVEVLFDESRRLRVEKIGSVPVDRARLMFADPMVLSAWKHEEPIDGRADFVFWGRDAEALAGEIAAPKSGAEFGWADLQIDEATRLAAKAEEIRSSKGWKLATDFRPHSHHWLAMREVRASKTESGTIEVAGAKTCVFMTSWGDGHFPVWRLLDPDGRIAGVRVQLETEESVARMRAVNE